MPDPKPAASLESVTMSYPEGLPGRLSLGHARRKPVLEGLTVSAPSGSCTAITGPNGCGKTTVLKLLAGLLLPDSGRVLVLGRDPVRDHRWTAARTGLALSGERSFYWRLSALHNLEYFGALAGMGGTALKRRISEVLALLGLEAVSRKPVESLSAGFRQRLSLARALVAEPLLLLLDEPFRSLDEDSRGGISDEVRRLCLKGSAVVVAAPFPAEVSALADRLETMVHVHPAAASSSPPGA